MYLHVECENGKGKRKTAKDQMKKICESRNQAYLIYVYTSGTKSNSWHTMGAE